MIDEAMTNQLKSLLDACCQLQTRMGADAKAAELLYCSRSLLTRLTLDGALAPQLAAKGSEQYGILQPAIEKVAGAIDAQQDILAQLHAAHGRLAKVESPEASALCVQLVKIEAAYMEAFEKAFREQFSQTATAQAAAAGSWDKESLAVFLRKVFARPDLQVKSIDMISGGFSKLTLKAEIDGGVDVPSVLVLRCDLPAGKAFTGTLVKDEFPILRTAHKHGVRVPQPYAMDDTGSVIGVPFIAFSFAAGRSVGTLFEFPPPDPVLGREAARQLALIHRIPTSELGVDVMGPEVATIDRIRREIDNSYAGWKSVSRSSAIVEEGFRILRRKVAANADGRRTLVHGDIGLHNMMVENSRITAMLDWEFGKLGNPADDLGYFYYTADHLLGWDAFIAEYVRAGGIAPAKEEIDFYRLLALVRVTGYIFQADAVFISGNLPQIQYAPPYNIYMRGTLMRMAQLLESFA